MKTPIGREKHSGKRGRFTREQETQNYVIESISTQFHDWHLRRYNAPYIEYGMRGAIALDAERRGQR